MPALPLGTMKELPESLLAGSDPAKLNVVLIEPMAASLPDRQFLLSSADYRVTSVRDTRELSLLAMAESLALAVISDALGGLGLVDAARSIRKQWPTARILVLGRASTVLEDHLYDDALPHSCGHQDFCDTLTRMSGQRTFGRPFIVTTPSSEHDSLQRRQVRSPDDAGLPDVPERMTQMW